MSTSDTAITTRTNGSEVKRQEFGAVQTFQQNETAAMATAAREKAVIEARFIYAMRNPRSIDDFEQELLKECRRPSFAAKVKYSLPKGKDYDTGEQKFIEGPSIRLVETALRCYKNSIAETATVFESEDLRIIRITVTDLESNLAYTSEVQIEKTVERKGFFDRKANQWNGPKGRMLVTGSDGRPVGRPNSYGDMVYRCVATEDEVLSKQNALISKAVRTLALRLLPGDVVDAAMDTAEATMSTKDAQDPDAAKKSLLASFASLEIMPSELEQYLGHATDRINPAELKTLRKIFVAVSNGETTWEQVMQNAAEGSTESAQSVADKKVADQEAKQGTAKSEKPAEGTMDRQAGGLFGGSRK
jgi:hypothetical protein